MEFSCNQDTLSKYLNSLSRIVNSKPGLPILNNVLFETQAGKLLMTVSDLELSMNCWIGADVKSEGKITVPAKQLSEFVNIIPNEKITASLDGNTMNISTVNNSAQFNTIPAYDYPAIAAIGDEKPLLKISMDDVLMAVKRVAFAASTDDVRPVMTGINVEIKEDTVAFVGADGFRLSRQIVKLLESAIREINLLIPAKALQELAHIVSEFASENSNNLVELYLIEDRNQVIFKYNDIELSTRLLDGQYPVYQQAIPTGYQTKTVLNRSDFQSAYKVVNIIARTVLGNKLYVEQDASDNQIKIYASQSEVGSNESVFTSEIEGEDMKMAFSSKLLGDMLSNIDAAELVFESSSATSPGVFRIKGDDSFLHLIMTMTL